MKTVSLKQDLLRLMAPAIGKAQPSRLRPLPRFCVYDGRYYYFLRHLRFYASRPRRRRGADANNGPPENSQTTSLAFLERLFAAQL